jgi:hypothetical protein
MGFEPAIPASERPQAFVLDRAATGIGRDEIMEIVPDWFLVKYVFVIQTEFCKSYVRVGLQYVTGDE